MTAWLLTFKYFINGSRCRLHCTQVCGKSCSMLNLNQTFDDTRAIKILVAPIGENSLFESHFNLISTVKDIQLFDLNKPSTWKTATQSVKHFNWTTGNLNFSFLRYDRGIRNDLDDFQLSRRVQMILVSCSALFLVMLENKWSVE